MKKPHEKIDFETFYARLRHDFPKLDSLSVWDKWDYSNESCEQCVVMSEVAREMIRWANEGNYEDVKKLLDYIELCITDAEYDVIAYIGTDFTVTILECRNREVRESIKKLMGPEVADAYRMNLGAYREPN